MKPPGSNLSLSGVEAHSITPHAKLIHRAILRESAIYRRNRLNTSCITTHAFIMHFLVHTEDISAPHNWLHLTARAFISEAHFDMPVRYLPLLDVCRLALDNCFSNAGTTPNTIESPPATRTPKKLITYYSWTHCRHHRNHT
jgi:hypothetical protein